MEKLYQDFSASTGKDNLMDKKEFRRLYKELYVVTQTTPLATSGPNVLTDHDLDKLSDRVFKAFDTEASGLLIIDRPTRTHRSLFLGKLTFEGNGAVVSPSIFFISSE